MVCQPVNNCSASLFWQFCCSGGMVFCVWHCCVVCYGLSLGAAWFEVWHCLFGCWIQLLFQADVSGFDKGLQQELWDMSDCQCFIFISSISVFQFFLFSLSHTFFIILTHGLLVCLSAFLLFWSFWLLSHASFDRDHQHKLGDMSMLYFHSSSFLF